MKPTKDNLKLMCPFISGSVERSGCPNYKDCGFGDCANFLYNVGECQSEEAMKELIVEINKTINKN